MASRTKSTDDLGTRHIAAHPELYTPSRDNNYVFYVHFKDRLLKAGVDADVATDSNYFDAAQAQEVLALSVTQAAVPHYTQTPIEVPRGNVVVKFAGAIKFDSGEFAFNDYIGAQTKDILMAWQRLSGDPLDQTVGEAEDYKMTATLIEYTPSHRQIRHWDFSGVWISGVSEGPLSSDSDGKRQVSATIHYDWAIPNEPEDMETVTFVSSTTTE